MTPNLYLTRSKELGIVPNFYCSLPYFDLSGWTVHSGGGLVWIEDDKSLVLPPLPLKDEDDEAEDILPNYKYVRAGFMNLRKVLSIPYQWDIKEFFDSEFIYNPKHFVDISGGKWKTFRKNSRKWPNSQDHQWNYIKPLSLSDIADLVGKWMEKKADSLFDSELIWDYCSKEIEGVKLMGVYDIDGNLRALNISDENYMYINYRYIITDGSLYIDEFARRLFYLDLQNQNKLVNDGGFLDSPGLFMFKHKLNPIYINSIYSLKIH